MESLNYIILLLGFMSAPSLTFIVAIIFQNYITRVIFYWTACVSMVGFWLSIVIGFGYWLAKHLG